SGTLIASNTLFYLAGTFTTGGIGTLVRTAGSIILIGYDDNSNATLTLANPGIGSTLLQGGTIHAGTLATSGGAVLVATPTGGRLDGLTLATGGTIDLSGISGPHSDVFNGL